MPRYRTLNNETEINVYGVRLRADPDGAFTVTAGSLEEQVLIAGGAVPIGLFSLQFDEFGNLLANVNHRVGLLANLLELSGGNGEIAKASDADALVVFNGVAGEAKAYFRSSTVGEVGIVAEYAQTVPAGAGTVYTGMDMAGTVASGNAALWDNVNEEFLAPANSNVIEVDFNFKFAASATGNYRRVKLQYWSVAGGAWGDLVTAEFVNANTALPVIAAGKLSSSFGATQTRLRLAFSHGDTAAAVVVTPNAMQITAKFKQL